MGEGGEGEGEEKRRGREMRGEGRKERGEDEGQMSNKKKTQKETKWTGAARLGPLVPMSHCPWRGGAQSFASPACSCSSSCSCSCLPCCCCYCCCSPSCQQQKRAQSLPPSFLAVLAILALPCPAFPHLLSQTLFCSLSLSLSAITHALSSSPLLDHPPDP